MVRMEYHQHKIAGTKKQGGSLHSFVFCFHLLLLTYLFMPSPWSHGSAFVITCHTLRFAVMFSVLFSGFISSKCFISTISWASPSLSLHLHIQHILGGTRPSSPRLHGIAVASIYLRNVVILSTWVSFQVPGPYIIDVSFLVLPLVHLSMLLSVDGVFAHLFLAQHSDPFRFTFQPPHLLVCRPESWHADVFCILPSHLIAIWFLGFLAIGPRPISSFTRSHLLRLGLPRFCFPPTVICNIFLVASYLSRFCTCQNHLNLFSLRNVVLYPVLYWWYRRRGSAGTR